MDFGPPRMPPVKTQLPASRLVSAALRVVPPAMLLVAMLLPGKSSCAWDIHYTPPQSVLLDTPTVVFITHASTLFDPLKVSQPGVNRVINAFRSLDIPIVCFHDRHNPNNPPGRYLYDDWNRLTIVSSDIGHYDFDMSRVRHVISMGGFFGCCERNTVADTVRLWRRDAPGENLRITQVVDGTFDMAEGVPDPVVAKVRQFQRDVVWSRHSKGSITVEQTLSLIDDDRFSVEFLRKQLPAFPAGVNVTMDYFGELIPIVEVAEPDNDSHMEDTLRTELPELVENQRPELVLAFRLSHDLSPQQNPRKPRRPSREILKTLQ